MCLKQQLLMEVKIMFNIIKADTKRLMRSKSIVVMPILILLMTAMLSALFAGLKYVMSLDLSAVLGDSMDALASIGNIANTGYDMAIMNLQSDTLIYVMIVILLSVSAFDFSAGTIKNMLSIGKSKKQIYLSKLITSCIWTILAVVFYAFSSTLMGSIFFGFDITGSQIANIVLITLQQIPVYVSVIVIGHMFVFMTQKVASSMLLYIGSFMLFETVVPLLDLIIDLPFKISLLMPLYQLIELTSMETDLVGYLTIYIACAIYIVTGIISGYYLFKRSELK